VRDLAGTIVGYSIRKGREIPADERFSPILQRVFEAGRLGQKSGKGFYRYEGRTRISDPEIMTLIEGVSRDLGITRREIPDDEILERLLCPLVNEGARIVEERIAIRSSDVDIVYVNGYGFPAYKGGPSVLGAGIRLCKGHRDHAKAGTHAWTALAARRVAGTPGSVRKRLERTSKSLADLTRPATAWCTSSCATRSSCSSRGPL